MRIMWTPYRIVGGKALLFPKLATVGKTISGAMLSLRMRDYIFPHHRNDLSALSKLLKHFIYVIQAREKCDQSYWQSYPHYPNGNKVVISALSKLLRSFIRVIQTKKNIIRAMPTIENYYPNYWERYLNYWKVLSTLSEVQKTIIRVIQTAKIYPFYPNYIRSYPNYNKMPHALPNNLYVISALSKQLYRIIRVIQSSENCYPHNSGYPEALSELSQPEEIVIQVIRNTENCYPGYPNWKKYPCYPNYRKLLSALIQTTTKCHTPYPNN